MTLLILNFLPSMETCRFSSDVELGKFLATTDIIPDAYRSRFGYQDYAYFIMLHHPLETETKAESRIKKVCFFTGNQVVFGRLTMERERER